MLIPYLLGKCWLSMTSKTIHFLILLSLSLLVCAICSCSNVGPKSISANRTAYAEAIDRTENEQLLLMIVKGRYGETGSLLAVNAVAANIRFRTEAGIEAGFGPDNISGENLLIGGMAYEENPTITYSPVQGHKYIRQIESPIPLDLLLLTMRHPSLGSRTMKLLINRANNLRNPHFLLKPTEDDGHDFQRFVDLFTELHAQGILELVKNNEEHITADIVISGYSSQYGNEVNEFLALLDLTAPEDQSKHIAIPTYFGINFDKSNRLAISTRTTLDLIEILRACVEVPDEHMKSNLALSYPPLGPVGKGIKIKSSKSQPSNASVSVPYRSYWYYIVETDHSTKQFFNALRTLWSITIDDSIDAKDVPLMTIPVSQ